MKELESNFIELAEQLEKKKKELDEIYSKIEEVGKQLGIGAYIQNTKNLAVYKIIEPDGTFITFRKVAYKRTTMPGEKGGTFLSKKEANEAGFVLE